jgi:hypothetical protein
VSSTVVEGFSLSHVAILDGTTGADHIDGDIFGVRSASLELSTDSYDNTGDNTVLSQWFWFNNATLTVQAGYVPFKTIALLSGSKLTSSGTGDADTYSLPLWEERQLNTGTKPVLIRVPARDQNGVARDIWFVLFKVQFQPFSFDGPSYKEGLLLNYTGTALMSDKDEKGQPVLDSVTGEPTKAIGRLLSKPTS